MDSGPALRASRNDELKILLTLAVPSMLWAVFTLIAAAAQTARNAMQRELTATLGTVGATHVRFLFGFPFALFVFLPGVMYFAGYSLPNPPGVFWLWVIGGALTQIGATATMLSVMGERSSVIGILSGSLFALSAIGYRGAILSLELPHFVMAATFTLAVGLVMQAAVLTAWLALRDPGVLRAIAKAWKPSLLAGFMGAFASEFWFLAFTIATAANVRTLALVEVLFAQGVTRFVFKQPTTAREGLGIVLVVIGVAVLVWAH